jgi:hypothetical protein
VSGPCHRSRQLRTKLLQPRRSALDRARGVPERSARFLVVTLHRRKAVAEKSLRRRRVQFAEAAIHQALCFAGLLDKPSPRCDRTVADVPSRQSDRQGHCAEPRVGAQTIDTALLSRSRQTNEIGLACTGASYARPCARSRHRPLQDACLGQAALAHTSQACPNSLAEWAWLQPLETRAVARAGRPPTAAIRDHADLHRRAPHLAAIRHATLRLLRPSVAIFSPLPGRWAARVHARSRTCIRLRSPPRSMAPG